MYGGRSRAHHPPSDIETGIRVTNVGFRLGTWNHMGGNGAQRGLVTAANASFHFADGSRRSPDAAWFDAKRWKEAQKPGTLFPVFAPEFVVEVRSPEQRARPLREKMDEYIANGVQLGWLIDPIEGTVTIYRPGQEPELLNRPASVSGEGPVEGFVLDLTGILTGS